MPPARTIHVDTNQMLANVAAIADGQRTALKREQARRDRKRLRYTTEATADAHVMAGWVPRDLEQLAGRSLTASERIRHQQAMRKLEADGLVELDTRHVRLTEAGAALVKGLGK